jgi:hypothetical protein
MTGEFIPGVYPPNNEPISRFLPPIPDMAAASWLQSRVPSASWVLDPFGTSPRLAVEMARAGYRVLVAANNPILRFLLELTAAPPSRQELQTSLAELAAAHRGTERIEPHIRSLYQTECARCGASIMAEAFLWENAEGGKSTAPAPYARIYTCPACRDTGEHACNQADIARATQFSLSSLHRARALERVAPHNDPDRPYAEQAINVYLPRAVYGLFTLINKIDGLEIPSERKRHLEALLLHAFDQANTMWKYPSERERRYQLVIPPRFRENNIWLALEQGIDLWCAEGRAPYAAPVPLFAWPPSNPLELPTSGIWLFEGRLKDMKESLLKVDIKAVCTALPRPNRAFWTLSALWAGWLWGAEAVGPFRSVLRRQRYDWSWHTTALSVSLAHLWGVLDSGTPFFGLMGEYEPNYMTAVLVAADIAGFGLEACALRPEIGQAQFAWSRKASFPETYPSTDEKIAVRSAMRHLEARAEPATFPLAFSAALTGVVSENYYHYLASRKTTVASSEGSENAPAELYSQATTICKEILSYRHGFLRYYPSAKGKPESSPSESTNEPSRTPIASLSGDLPESPEALLADREKHSSELAETGYVWLREPSQSAIIPLADRIEIALVNYLLKHPGCSTNELDTAMCKEFTGLFTPNLEYLQICLDSYAEVVETPHTGWKIRAQDLPSARRKDLSEAVDLIQRLGERLGFITRLSESAEKVSRSWQGAIYWEDRFSEPQYWLFPVVSAVIGEVILHSQVPAGKGLIILPGGRANLVAYKLRCDPRLNRLCDPDQGGWRLIKFRHLRWLENNPLLSRENLDELLTLDPLTYETPQLRLL